MQSRLSQAGSHTLERYREWGQVPKCVDSVLLCMCKNKHEKNYLASHPWYSRNTKVVIMKHRQSVQLYFIDPRGGSVTIASPRMEIYRQINLIVSNINRKKMHYSATNNDTKKHEK